MFDKLRRSGLILAAALATTPQLGLAETLKLKLQTHFNPSLSVIGEASENLVKTIESIAGDDIKIRFYEANKLAPTVDTFGAVRDGTIDAVIGWPGYFAGQLPALTVFAAIPFGPRPEEYMTWMYEGEGSELANEIFEEHGVHAVLCGLIPSEGGGWFREALGSSDDLVGKKIRWSGTGGRVLQKMGASISMVPAGEIFPNMERGVLDATEFSLPSVDRNLGLYKIAKHFYVPGWHSPYQSEFLMVNKDVWDGASDRQRAMIEVACQANVTWTYARGLGEQAEAMAFYEQEGVQVHEWSKEDLAKFRETFNQLIEEEIAADESYANAYRSVADYVESLRVWTSKSSVD
ncbi:TRAP transporter substrate-binding protein [Lutimaribacter marinistellae]|uniref:TRAP transporter substrate-binding protein n=1 Tax=Lutimaribacter marinistellae TaxID=1820329 RepID=A0ABV7TDM4_9RHOB